MFAVVDGSPPSWVARVLRVPLLTKIVLLDLLINVVVLLAMRFTPPELQETFTLVSLLGVLVVNAALVAWALRPLRILEDTALRVANGEFTARAHLPAQADRNLARIAQTLDALLDRIVRERERARTLAAQVVAAGDRERAHIARELHDGTAQSLFALEMLLSSTLAEEAPGPLTQRLGQMRDIARDALEEVRTLSHSVHPRVLDDLGLGAALEHLARRMREPGGADVTVHVGHTGDPPRALAAVLYRVAQEALQNAVKHGRASSIGVRFAVEDDHYVLTVADDGDGFDRAAVEAARRGMGLFVMEERVSLVDGTIEIRTARGRGTTVRVTVPVEAA